jgi:ketosteroid isomerase-like protein
LSQENVQVVRRNYRAFTARQLDAALEGWDPEGEWVPAMAGAVEGKSYRGHAEIRRYFEDLFASFSDVRVEDLDFTDLGDRVLVLYRLVVRGRDSDVAIDPPGAALYEFRDGKIVTGRSFLSQAEALEAAGLSE